MRKQPDDDLASALPSSLTVDLHLPEPIHEAPLDEKAIAIDDVAVTPAGDSPATRSIPIVMSAVEIAGDTEALVPGATDTAESEPDEIVPLPVVDEVTPIVTRSRRAPKPSKPGRRPRPEGRVAELVYAATLH